MRIKSLVSGSSYVALLLLFSATVVTAQDTSSVFGMRLGQPLTIPECERNEYLWYVGSNTCYKRDPKIYGVPEDKKFDMKYIKNYTKNNPPPALGTEQVEISFSASDWPQYISPSNTSALLIDARLEGMQFFTFGVSNADLMLERLKTKYGASTSFLPLKVKNGLGLPFDAFIASWRLPNLVVTFYSVETSLDHGRVTIDTGKGDAWRMQRLKESLKDKNPL